MIKEKTGGLAMKKTKYLCFNTKILLCGLILFVSALFLLTPANSFAAKGKGGRVGEKVSFSSKEGFNITGLFVRPAGPGMKTFILLHGLASSQDEWQGFVHDLTKHGYGFLSYDARGHGKSLIVQNGMKLTYDSFGPPAKNSNWEKMVSDLDSAVNFLITAKNIRPNKIGLIGASLGANVCLLYASNKDSVNPVVLLSPGIDYAGLNTNQAIFAFKGTKNKYRPIAIVASPNDTYAFQSACYLYKQIESNKKSVLIQGQNSNHGVQMLDKTMVRKIFSWINNY